MGLDNVEFSIYNGIMNPSELPQPIVFEWDKGNERKNYEKHKISGQETEETFFDAHKKLYEDIFHSGKENRYILIGKTQKFRLLYVVFTIRNNKVRAISARDLNRKERHLYEEET